MGPLTFEQFGLRDNELVQLWPEYPADKPRVVAARTVPVAFPKGEVNPVCETGQPVELAALVFAEKTAKGWQWVHMTPTTKSYLASLMMDSDFKYHPGVWVYFSIENNTLPVPKPATGEQIHKVWRAALRSTPDGKAEGTRESLAMCARMIDTYAPDLDPANEQGQVSFSRAMMESVAEEITAFLATLPAEQEVKPNG